MIFFLKKNRVKFDKKLLIPPSVQVMDIWISPSYRQVTHFNFDDFFLVHELKKKANITEIIGCSKES